MNVPGYTSLCKYSLFEERLAVFEIGYKKFNVNH